MPIDVLFAGVAVADFKVAVAWYDLLFGRPADIVVHDGEVMWQVVSSAWLYVVADPGRAGRALVTMAVPDLDAAVGEIEGRGIPRPPIETIGDAGHKATYADPEGNTVAFVEVSSGH